LQNVVISEELSSGVFGIVYKGTYGDKLIALKKFKCDQMTLDKMWMEIDVHRNLASNHPNILQFLGYFRDDKDLYIVTEFMELGDLESFLSKRGTLYEVRHKFFMALQIAAAMQYLEKINYTHRDLACRNVLIRLQDKKLVFKVGDFGLTRPGYYQMNANSSMSLHWSAPEVLARKDSTIKSDVWSFGCTFWEIINNGLRPPIVCHGDNVNKYKQDMLDIQDKVVKGKVSGKFAANLKDFPEAALPLFDLVWVKEPEKRISFEKTHNYLKTLLRYIFTPKEEIKSLPLFEIPIPPPIKVTEEDEL
jgi:serine/threonine protein kinase